MVSIVIPNYFIKGKKTKYCEDEVFTLFYRTCIKRIKKYTKDYQLILIDNGSEFGLEEIEKDADIVVKNEVNLGFGKSCNQGFRVATGDWIVCMNNDVFVYEGWIEALQKTFEDNSNCGFAMPALIQKMKDAYEADKIEDISPYLQSNRNRYGPTTFGSLWMAKREVLEKVQLKGYCIFDERYELGFREDKDLFRRVERDLGLIPLKTHNTRVFHQGNVTIAKIPGWREATAKNRELFAKDWGTDEELAKKDREKWRKEAKEQKKEVELLKKPIPLDKEGVIEAEVVEVEGSWEPKEMTLKGSDGKPKTVKEKRIAIFTTFAGFDPGYALHVGTLARARMMKKYGLNFDTLVQTNFKSEVEFPNMKAVIPRLRLRKYEEDPNQYKQNIVILRDALPDILKEYDIVITHDLIYQRNFLPHNTVIHELAKKYDHIRWFHWIHSGPKFPRETKHPQKYLHTLPKNSKIVYMNETDSLRIAESYGTTLDNVRVVFNTKEPSEFFRFDPITTSLIYEHDLFDADIMQTFPFSTPRHEGKQVTKVIRLFSQFKKLGHKVKLVLVNAHSNNNEGKVAKLREYGTKLGLDNKDLIITSEGGHLRGLPREVVADLFQISNLFVFPSTSEVCPNVLLEASIAGNFLVINESLPCLKDFCSGKVLANWGFGSVHFNVNHENEKAEENWYKEVAKIIAGEIYKERTYHTRKHAFQHFNYKYVFEKQFLPMISEI